MKSFSRFLVVIDPNHHESASLGYEDTPEKKAHYEKERAYMKSRWPHF